MDVMRLDEAKRDDLTELLSRFGLSLRDVSAADLIPGSFWGDSEAGLVRDELYARPDTPVHSVLHECAHFVCMTPERREMLEQDAGGDDAEETAVCYLQVLLSDHVPSMGRERMFRDMDAWGYSFRLGASRAWFETDAEDALSWLTRHGIVDRAGNVSWSCRGREEVRR